MKKNVSRILTLAMAAVLALSLAACGAPADTNNPGTPNPGTNNPGTTDPGSTPSNGGETAKDWTHTTDEQWVAENWDAKTPAYQFTGQWDMGDPNYNFVFDFLLNLFEDGSVRVNQYSAAQGNYFYFGFWSEEETEDGNEISLTIRRETPLQEGGELVSHKYTYTLYEESDGSYSFGFDFAMVPGQYFRVADLKGSSNIVYKSIDEFHAASEAGAFTPEKPEGSDQPAGGDEPAETSYPAHTMVVPFTPDSSEQLKTEFYCDSVTWGTALGATGTYEPTGAEDVILSFTSDGSPNYHLDFKADGTYEYQFTTVSITETGTWSFTGWTLTVTTANGNTFTGSITQ